MDFLFSHLTPNSLVVMQYMRREDSIAPGQYKYWKRLDLFGHKVYLSANLHYRIANYETLLSRYNGINCSKLNGFIEHILED